MNLLRKDTSDRIRGSEESIAWLDSVRAKEALESGLCASVLAPGSRLDAVSDRFALTLFPHAGGSGRELLKGGQPNRRFSLPRDEKCLSSKRSSHTLDLLVLTN